MPAETEKFPYRPDEMPEVQNPESTDKELEEKRERYFREILAKNPQMPAGEAIKFVAARIQAEEEAKKEQKE